MREGETAVSGALKREGRLNAISHAPLPRKSAVKQAAKQICIQVLLTNPCFVTFFNSHLLTAQNC